jgi:Na+-driven multidrug efflux pump
VFCATIFVIAGFLLVNIFPRFFISIFSKDEGELMETGVLAIHICTAILPAIGFQIFSSNFFQSIGKPVQGTILSLSRQILLYIPLLMILPLFFGIRGVFYAMPAADICSFALSLVVTTIEITHLQARDKRNKQ